jgi:hypothetical protein
MYENRIMGPVQNCLSGRRRKKSNNGDEFYQSILYACIEKRKENPLQN